MSTFSDINIGSISSLVDKYTENNVPRVIILVIYRLVARAENPHCGITPRIEPSTGPYFFDLVITFLLLSVSLCSIYSLIKGYK